MGPNGEETDSVAIVTAPASRDLAVLHHRVPVTIAPEEFERWLDGRLDNADDVMPLLRGPAEGEFAWHEISTRVNRVVNDDAQLLLPITDEQRARRRRSLRRPRNARRRWCRRMTGRARCFEAILCRGGQRRGPSFWNAVRRLRATTTSCLWVPAIAGRRTDVDPHRCLPARDGYGVGARPSSHLAIDDTSAARHSRSIGRTLHFGVVGPHHQLQFVDAGLHAANPRPRS